APRRWSQQRGRRRKTTPARLSISPYSPGAGTRSGEILKAFRAELPWKSPHAAPAREADSGAARSPPEPPRRSLRAAAPAAAAGTSATGRVRPTGLHFPRLVAAYAGLLDATEGTGVGVAPDLVPRREGSFLPRPAIAVTVGVDGAVVTGGTPAALRALDALGS